MKNLEIIHEIGFFSDPNWSCQDGKGYEGNSFSQKTSDNLNECKIECIETADCIALDYSPKSKACRLFKENKVKSSPQDITRVHCGLGKFSLKCIDLSSGHFTILHRYTFMNTPKRFLFIS